MKKKKLILAVAILTLIMVVIGATYAYFVTQTGAGQSANINVQAGTTDSLKFEVSNDLNIYASVENFAEGQDNLAKDTNLKATLKPNNNTNEATYNYYVYLDISKNELEYTTEDNKPELLLKVTKPDGTELTTIDGLEYKSVVNNKGEEVSGFDITTKRELITIADNYEIHASGSELTQEWNIEIILVNLGSDQNKNTNKNIEAEAKIQERGMFVLKDGTYFSDTWGPRTEPWDNELITALVFEPSKNIHEDAIKTYDMSYKQDGSIMGYEVKNDYDDGHTLYINSDGDMLAGDVENWFLFYSGLDSIKGIEYFNISQLKRMYRMFAMSGYASLDLSSFDTSRVISMNSMFYSSATREVNLSSFDTSNVISMADMFNGASGLTNLDVRNFDTSQVTSMSGMFSYASGLTTLDLSSFDTSQVTDMRWMFKGCSSLTELDISNMTFDGVTKSSMEMFEGVPNNIHIKVKDEAAKAFIEARLAEANITEGVVEIVSR